MILNPLDYEEFQWALGNKVSIPIMRKLFESNKGIGDAGARGEMRNLRLYMLVGGMPQYRQNLS